MLLHEMIEYTSAGGWGEEVTRPGLEPVRIVRGADFPEAEFQSLTNCPVRFEAPARIANRQCRPGDIILESSGGTATRPTGRTVYLTGPMISSSTEPVIPASFARLVRVNPEIASPRFVYYALRDFHARGLAWEFQNRSTGLANFQFARFASEYELELPPMATQNSIAQLLGALDDKIATNRTLVATALELVTLHHRQLQVSASMQLLRYADVAHVGGGGTPSTKEARYWDGDIPWAAPSDITALAAPYLENTPRKITEQGLAACSSPMYPAGSILMTSRATIGAFAVAQMPVAVNQGFIVVQPHDPALRWWLLEEMQQRVPEYISRANGATFLELPRKTFRDMEFSRPDDAALQRFDQLATPLHLAAIAAQREATTLATLRDTLLPALMDGTIRVKDAITAVEGVL